MRRATKRKLWTAALVVAVVLLYRLWGTHLREPLGLEGPPLPSKGGSLRVANWNLRNFPDHPGHAAALGTHLAEIDADVLALQEVHDPGPLREMLPGWNILVSQAGGRGQQHLVIAFDPADAELLDGPHEERSLTLGGRVRPAFHAYLRGQPDGPDFHVVVVHLKAFPDGYVQRRTQWDHLSDLLARLATTDEDILVVGDFNTTGPVGGTGPQEVQAIARSLAPRLRRMSPTIPCSSYWDGDRRDAWKEPSLLDHVWLAGLAESVVTGDEAAVGSHCARHACRPLRSTDAYPDLDFATASDHCPLIVDLRRSDDDVAMARSPRPLATESRSH